MKLNSGLENEEKNVCSEIENSAICFLRLVIEIKLYFDCCRLS
jgi:hypothetical protein